MLIALGAGADRGAWPGSTHATMASRSTNVLKAWRKKFWFIVFSTLKNPPGNYMPQGRKLSKFNQFIGQKKQYY
jgi:hypothetical protein